MTETEERANARRAWMVLRKGHLGQSEVDVAPVFETDGISLLHRLTLMSYSLAGQSLPTYSRDQIPCKFVRRANLADARTDELARTCHIIFNLEAVQSQARRLLRLHPLRATDALQLAAALERAKGKTSGRTFITLDKQLALGAIREGFTVLPD